MYVEGLATMTEPIEVAKLNEDLHYILVEKTSGEAASKVKSVENGLGFLAYYRLY